jgi:hypothetical protein
MPGFSGNAGGTDDIREVQKHGVLAGVAGEDFNVAAVRPHRRATDSEVSDVDEASVSYVEKLVIEGKSEPMMGPVTFATTKRHESSRRKPKSKRRVMQP